MIKKIFFIVLGAIFVYYSLAFIMLNIGYFVLYFKATIQSIEDLTNFPLQTNLNLLKTPEYTLYQRVVFLGTIFIIALILVNNLSTFFESRGVWLKNKYERASYSKWLTKIQRTRGSLFVKVSKKGNVVYTGVEELFIKMKNPIAKLQNKYVEWRMLPDTKKWNTIPTYINNGEKTRISGGVPVMALRKYLLFGKFNRLWYLTGDKHSLFVASTGKGKSMTFVLPMIFSYIAAEENMVIHDPKGELYAHTKDALKDAGYKIVTIDFVRPECSDGWNPLDVPYKAWKEALIDAEERLMQSHDLDIQGNFIERSKGEVIKKKDLYKHAELSEAVEQVLDIARAMSFEEDAKNPYWHEGAGDMIAGCSLFMMEEGNEDYVNLTSGRYLIQLGDEDGKGTLLKKYLNENRDVDAPSRSKLDTYLTAEGVTKSGLKSVFNNKMSLVTATDAIARMTSKSTFDMRDVFTEKTAVLLMTHDEKSTYYPLVTMFFKQLYEVGIKESRKNPMRRLKIPMNWVIDEFAQLPEIKDIGPIYGAARSRGVRINAFIQSFSQLEEKYEKNVSNIIEDNSTNVIYIGSMTTEAQAHFSDIAGDELVWDKKKKDFITRPLITKTRLSKMEKGRSLIKTLEWDPFMSKLPPFTRYVHYRKPDWDKEVKPQEKVKFFNIKEASKTKLNKKLSKLGSKRLEVNNFNEIDTNQIINNKKLEDRGMIKIQD